MPNDIKGSDIMKKTEEINQIIVELYDLIINKEFKERERVSLIEAKNKLEKKKIFKLLTIQQKYHRLNKK